MREKGRCAGRGAAKPRLPASRASGSLRSRLPDAFGVGGFGVGGFAAHNTVKHVLPSFYHHIITLTAFTAKKRNGTPFIMLSVSTAYRFSGKCPAHQGRTAHQRGGEAADAEGVGQGLAKQALAIRSALRSECGFAAPPTSTSSLFRSTLSAALVHLSPRSTFIPFLFFLHKIHTISLPRLQKKRIKYPCSRRKLCIYKHSKDTRTNSC